MLIVVAVAALAYESGFIPGREASRQTAGHATDGFFQPPTDDQIPNDEFGAAVRRGQAAFITFAERGYEKASMDEVALVAETTKRTVYAHFGNKEALFRDAIGQAVDWFLSELPDAREKMENWRRDYNEVRPHGAIGNKVPIALMNPGHAPIFTCDHHNCPSGR